MSASPRVWTRALPAGDIHSQHGVSVIAFQTDLTVVSRGALAAVVALASLGVAGVGVAVALAGLAVGEVPVAGLALVTLTPVCGFGTIALAVVLATKGIQGAKGMTITG